MVLVDTHCHIEMRSFDRDRKAVIERARSLGVRNMVAVGVDLEDSRRAVTVAGTFDGVFAAVGIHPHDAKKIDGKTYDILKQLADNDRVVAWGEIGLDFFRNLSPRAEQNRRFREQLDLADDLNLPVIIHDRDAHGETLGILKQWKGGRTGGKRGVVHCFSGDTAMAQACIDLGFYISIPATVTYRNANRTRDVVRAVPMERLLIETDAPFLSPEPLRRERNEPAHVLYTARKVAEIRGMEPEQAGEITSRNASELFGFEVFP